MRCVECEMELSKKHHSAHTEMIAHEQELHALIKKSQFMVAEPRIYGLKVERTKFAD